MEKTKLERMNLSKYLKTKYKDVKDVDPADVDDVATAKDIASADKNIMIQLKKQIGLGNSFKVEFGDKKKARVPDKIAKAAIALYDKHKTSQQKGDYQNTISKSYKDLLSFIRKGKPVAMEAVVIQEPLDPEKHDVKKYIDDFQKSTNPQFDGISQEKRKEMAIAAYAKAKENKEDTSKELQKALGKLKKNSKEEVTEVLDKDDETIVKKVIDKLKKASQAHAGQSKDLQKALDEDELGEKVGPKDKVFLKFPNKAELTKALKYIKTKFRGGIGHNPSDKIPKHVQMLVSLQQIDMFSGIKTKKEFLDWLDKGKFKYKISFTDKFKEEVELDESLKTTHVLIDTSKNNEVIGTASDEKDIKQVYNDTARYTKKSVLKIVKLKRPASVTKKDKLFGYPLHKWGEEVELDENFRTLATKGMGTETKQQAKVGQELDFYEPKLGDKFFGKIIKMDNKGYQVRGLDRQFKGKIFTFKYYDKNKAKKLLQKEEHLDERSKWADVVAKTDAERLAIVKKHYPFVADITNKTKKDKTVQGFYHFMKNRDKKAIDKLDNIIKKLGPKKGIHYVDQYRQHYLRMSNSEEEE
jgi:hypothetical protein